MNQQSNRRKPSTDSFVNLRSIAATAVAAALGAIAGGIAASRLPSDKFAWTGFALLPLLLLVEVYLKRFAAVFAGSTDAARLMLAGAIVAGFYGAWFVVR